MGWSNSAMVKRCAHVTARLRRDIANWLNSFSGTTNENRRNLCRHPCSLLETIQILKVSSRYSGDPLDQCRTNGV